MGQVVKLSLGWKWDQIQRRMGGKEAGLLRLFACRGRNVLRSHDGR